MKMQMAGALTLSAALMLALAAPAAYAHEVSHGMRGGTSQQPEQGYGPMMGYGMGGPGMMGYGMGGPGMMGYGMMGYGMGGPGMMGYGMGGPGMMGRGMMGDGAYGPCPMAGRGGYQPLARDLSIDDVRHMMQHRVERSGNPNLKLGEVAEHGEDAIAADVVTQDGSLVRRFVVDRHTGAMHPSDREE